MTTVPFQVARATLPLLDGWVAALAAPHLPARRATEPDGKFTWDFPEHSALTVQVAKAVRMVSGIHAAMRLADLGFTTETGTILRTVSEFQSEIVALCEGVVAGRLAPEQQRFVEQFFARPPRSPEELERSERARYVSREELFKGHKRLAARTDTDADELLRLTRFLNKGFDSYVHGSYETAMELYRGDLHRFELSGVPFERSRCIARRAVVGKLHEVLVGLAMMATVRHMEALYEEIRSALKRLEESDEQAANCDRILASAPAV